MHDGLILASLAPGSPLPRHALVIGLAGTRPEHAGRDSLGDPPGRADAAGYERDRPLDDLGQARGFLHPVQLVAEPE